MENDQYLGLLLLDGDSDLPSPAIFNLRKINVKHAVFHAGGGVANTNRPTQVNNPPELPIEAFGTEIRHDTPPGRSSFLFTINSEFGVAEANLDLFGADAGKLGAHDYHLFRFTNVDGRCPCTRDQRVLCFSRFLKSSEKSSYPISQPLQLEPL